MYFGMKMSNQNMVKIQKSLCYMDKDWFIVHGKTETIYKDIAEDV